MHNFNNEQSLCEPRSIRDKTIGVNEIISEVWNSKTFADLVEFERNSNAASVPNYII